jgi:type III secretory pathway component EscT
MKETYSILERVLLRVFGLYLIAAAWITLDRMISQDASELVLLATAFGFTVFWLVGGVIAPAFIKNYEINKLMEDIKNSNIIIKKRKKNKNGK